MSDININLNDDYTTYDEYSINLDSNIVNVEHYKVKTINGIEPDANGNIEFPIEEVQLMTLDTQVTAGSNNPVTSNAVHQALPNMSSYAKRSELPNMSNYALKSEIPDISTKQNVITDLETIRSGATLGATALQEHQDISGKQDKLTAGDNITIENNVISAQGGGSGGMELLWSGRTSMSSGFSGSTWYKSDYKAFVFEIASTRSESTKTSFIIPYSSSSSYYCSNIITCATPYWGEVFAINYQGADNKLYSTTKKGINVSDMTYFDSTYYAVLFRIWGVK